MRYEGPPSVIPLLCNAIKIIDSNSSSYFGHFLIEKIKRVSHPCGIKYKTLFIKIDLNTFPNRGYFYGHFEKKN